MEPPRRPRPQGPTADQLRQALAPRLTAADSFGVAKDRSRSLVWRKRLRTPDEPLAGVPSAEGEGDIDAEPPPPPKRDWLPLSQLASAAPTNDEDPAAGRGWFDRYREFRRRMRDQIMAFRRNRGLMRIDPRLREHLTDNWNQLAVNDIDNAPPASTGRPSRGATVGKWLAFLLLLAALVWVAQTVILRR